jgi:endonuclease G
MSQSRHSRRRPNLFKLNPRRLLATGAAVFALTLSVFVVHFFSPQPAKDKIEATVLDVIDLVRENEIAPPELVFWLDLLADNLPLTRGKVVAPGTLLKAGELTLGGVPETAHSITLLSNKGYIVAYDEERKNPAWVAYKVFKPKYPPHTRPERFESDPRTRARVESSVYSRSGFDRGHMAPNRAISLCYGPEAQKETFLMSNIVPQRHGLNGAFWEAMERRIMDRYTRRYGDVWVFCGPLYDTGKRTETFKGGIAVPDAFFLLIAEQSSGGIRVESFVVPHRDIKKTADPTQFLVSVREIEGKAGLNFFPALPLPVQDELELTPAKRAW